MTIESQSIMSEVMWKLIFYHVFNFTIHPEKSGTVEFLNKKMYKNGFYQADLYSCGRRVKKGATFFPSHWSNERVIESIFEAYDEFVKSKKTCELYKGKYAIIGKTKGNISIEMIIDQKGKISTAYPLLQPKQVHFK